MTKKDECYVMKEEPYPFFNLLMMPYASRALLVSIIELDMFSKLHNNPLTLSEVCEVTGIKQRPAQALLRVFVALNLLHKREDRYHISALSEEFFVRGKPFFMGDGLRIYLEIEKEVYEQFKNAVLTDSPQIYEVDDVWELHKEDGKKVSSFTRWMHVNSLVNGSSLVENFDFSNYNKILDVAGGSGGIPIMILSKNPHITAMIFDIPSVCKEAEKTIAEYGLSDRVTTMTGDMFKDDLPTGTDVITLSRILHDWPFQVGETLLTKCFNALPSNGVIIIIESLIDDDIKPDQISPLLENLAMLIWTTGQQYTEKEISDMLKKIGFININIAPLTGYHHMIAAYKP
ncbi:MAG: hypothetical protein GY749_33255 [Desulfobacteraceae bacterium]|nr:hypothetical protein [Desulfobacteraceae bacterium]